MNSTESVRPIDFGAIWRRGWIVLLCAIIGGGVAYLHARGEPKEYSATSELLFGNSSVLQALGLSNGADQSQAGVLQATDQNLVGLPVISQQTASALGKKAPPGGFTVSSPSSGSSNIVDVVATARTPAGAALVANTYAQQFINYSLQTQQNQVQSAITAIRSSIAAEPKSAAASTQVVSLEKTLGQLEAISVSKPLNVSIAQTATVPKGSSGPRKSRDAVLGALIGLVVGLIFAILLGMLDPRFHNIGAVADGGELEVLELERERSGASGLRRTAVRLVRRMRQPPSFARDAEQGFVNGVFLSGTGKADAALRARLTEATAEAAVDAGLATAILRFDSGADIDVPAAVDSSASAPEEESDADVDESAEDVDETAEENARSFSGVSRDRSSPPPPMRWTPTPRSSASAQQDEIGELATRITTDSGHESSARADVFAARAGVFTDDAEASRLLRALRRSYAFVLVDLATSEVSSAADALIGGANAVVIGTRVHRSNRRSIERQVGRIQGLRDDPVVLAVARRQSLKAPEQPAKRAEPAAG